MKRPDHPARRAVRIVFVLYALALFAATHWPKLTPPGMEYRSDLFIHAGVLCVWTCLLYATAWIGGCACGKRRLVWTSLVALCYAVFDESTQPMFNRHFDLMDIAADSAGVLLALLLIVGWRRVWPGFRGDLVQ